MQGALYRFFNDVIIRLPAFCFLGAWLRNHFEDFWQHNILKGRHSRENGDLNAIERQLNIPYKSIKMPSQAEHDDIAKFNSFAISESVILRQVHVFLVNLTKTYEPIYNGYLKGEAMPKYLP